MFRVAAQHVTKQIYGAVYKLRSRRETGNRPERRTPYRSECETNRIRSGRDRRDMLTARAWKQLFGTSAGSCRLGRPRR